MYKYYKHKLRHSDPILRIRSNRNTITFNIVAVRRLGLIREDCDIMFVLEDNNFFIFKDKNGITLYKHKQWTINNAVICNAIRNHFKKKKEETFLLTIKNNKMEIFDKEYIQRKKQENEHGAFISIGHTLATRFSEYFRRILKIENGQTIGIARDGESVFIVKILSNKGFAASSARNLTIGNKGFSLFLLNELRLNPPSDSFYKIRFEQYSEILFIYKSHEVIKKDKG